MFSVAFPSIMFDGEKEMEKHYAMVDGNKQTQFKGIDAEGSRTNLGWLNATRICSRRPFPSRHSLSKGSGDPKFLRSPVKHESLVAFFVFSLIP